jgi:hypothetical protein
MHNADCQSSVYTGNQQTKKLLSFAIKKGDYEVFVLKNICEKA